MNKPDSHFNSASGLFIDIGQSLLQAVQGGDAFEFPLERAENGRLTDLCRERLTTSLRGFLSRKSRARLDAWCAIGARGVSLRRLNLPVAAKDEFQRVLRLQIESEFPLPPDELAWGSRPVGPPVPAANGAPARQELLVVAVKKDALEDYAAIFAACGVTPLFTLAALARGALHPPLPDSCAVLHIGRAHSEWVAFDRGVPTSIRVLPWGGETITLSIQRELGVTHDDAEKLKLAPERPDTSPGQPAGQMRRAVELAVASLADSLKTSAIPRTIYLTGKGARDPRIAPMLAGLLGGGAACESLELARDGGPSAAILGLKKSAAPNSDIPPLVLELKHGADAAKPARTPAWKWAAATVLLALAAICFPYAEALLLKPRLEKKLAAVNADRGRLDSIDQELAFLQFLKQSQPPYLDTLYLLAKSAPQGTRLDALTVGRRGDISMRAKMATGQQVTDFRAKLMDSGWFASVVVEEQTPSPDRRVSVRMTAQLNAAELRKPLVVEPSTNKPGSRRFAPMMMPAMPDNMMMGMDSPPPGGNVPPPRAAMPPDNSMPPMPARGGGRRRAVIIEQP